MNAREVRILVACALWGGVAALPAARAVDAAPDAAATDTPPTATDAPPTATAAPPTALDSVRAAIDAGNARWVEAITHDDAAALARIFTDDGVQVSFAAGRAWKGRDSLETRWSTIFAGTAFDSAVVRSTEVSLHERTACEMGSYEYAVRDKATGKRSRATGRYVVVWRRANDGAWRILLDMGLPPD